jgi:alkylation response protein AidB-like acyl-CoA dehydrogenase
MNLDLNTEQRLLKNSARDFLKKECPTSLVREARDAEEDFPKKLWKKMAKLGWMGVTIPEKYDGMGGDFLDLMILVEAMGEACLPAPFFSTVAIAGTALQLSSAETLKEEILPQIAAGDLIVAFALIEPGNAYGLENIKTTAVEKDGNFILDGTKLFVEYAGSSDFLLTVCQVPEKGLGVFLVKTNSPGIETKPLKTLDYAKQREVVFGNVNVPDTNLIALGSDAQALLQSLEEQAAVAKCAEMLGGMQSAFDMSVAYAKEREQFDRPIGSFQAIQHHCANMAVELGSSRYITSFAAWKISKGMPAAKEVSMAKWYTNNASSLITKLGHQIHAAISYCDEHDMHLFLRKCKAASIAFGDTEYHLEKVAGELGL